MSKEITIQIPENAKGGRLDLFLANSVQKLDFSRARIQDLIREGLITVEGKRIKPHHKLSGLENVRIRIPENRPLDVLPSDIPVRILYEDADLVVVDKPAGMVVHPAPGNLEGTLVNALLHHCKDLSGIGGVERPGIVHRLDKETSGVMVAVKNDNAHRGLSAQMKARTIKKIYLAVVKGVVKEPSGSIETQIGRHEQHRKKMTVHPRRGRKATTFYQVQELYENHTLVQLQLKTGRTHQIRVHLAHLRHPVIGDPVYGGKHNQTIRQGNQEITVKRQMLHSRLLGFTHPRTKEQMEFEAKIPEDMQKVIDFLRGKK